MSDQIEEIRKASDQLKEAMAELVYNEKKSTVGELMGGVAHELNQPLNCINIIAQGVLRDIEKNRFQPEEIGKELNEIVSQVGKMTETINHARTFSRRQESEVNIEVDVNHVVESALKLVGQRLKARNVDYETDLQSDLPKIKSDPGKLEQIIMNLIFNARDAILEFRKQDGHLKIKTGILEGSPKSVVISLSDNGGGIPAALLNKIFMPFFTTKEPGKNAGLGLWIAKKLMKELEGKITLDVREGEGCQFSLVLPTTRSEVRSVQ